MRKIHQTFTRYTRSDLDSRSTACRLHQKSTKPGLNVSHITTWKKMQNRKWKPKPGEVFGRLLVMGDIGIRDRYHRKKWQCFCSCGALTYVTTNALRTGNTTSCGCYQREVVANMKPIKRKCEFCGCYFVGHHNRIACDSIACQARKREKARLRNIDAVRRHRLREEEANKLWQTRNMKKMDSTRQKH